jgi:hypothetical protein
MENEKLPNKEVIKQILNEIEKIPSTEPEKTIAKMITIMGGNPINILSIGLNKYLTNEAEQKNPKLPMPKDYTKTERILHEMLIENTGAHFLDSGGIYGRHWERNRKIKDFRKLPIIKIENDIDGPYISINIFHFLNTFLERDNVSEFLEEYFYKLANSEEWKDLSWLGCIEEFADVLKELGYKVYNVFNSYNWENLLSQGIQGMIFENENSRYIILQIHNGCDIRGGYTAPRIFKLNEDDDGLFFLAMSEIGATCKCIQVFSDDCGYHWYGYENDKHEFPKQWEWNKDKKAYVCKKCKNKVKFYNSYIY